MSERRWRTAPGRAALLTSPGVLLIDSIAWAVSAPEHDPSPGRQSITEHGLTLPAWDDVVRVLAMADSNTRVVTAGVTLLGLAAGVIGTFLLLRKRSLTADALAHATMPGIAAAFMIAVGLGAVGKSLPVLLAGAFVSGVIGMGFILAIRHTTRIKDDAALGIVLGVFFGLGAALLKLAEKMPGGSAAGLNSFIDGKAASMVRADAWVIFGSAIAITCLTALLYKELKLLCFDPDFAQSQGRRTLMLDAILMTLVAAVTVIGLQSVGLVLIVAILIIPAAAARFWTDNLSWMTVWSAGIGAGSGYLGAMASGLFDKLPTGPIIVLVCSAIFAVSLVFGARRGVLIRAVRHARLSRRIALQHLLRGMYELSEGDAAGPAQKVDMPGAAAGPARAEVSVPLKRLAAHRTWSARRVRRTIRLALRAGFIRRTSDAAYALTAAGWVRARRIVRNHRLWEVYLITHAEIASTHVDRDADQIEHVLSPELIDRLEARLAERFPNVVMPESPHAIGGDA